MEAIVFQVSCPICNGSKPPTHFAWLVPVIPVKWVILACFGPRPAPLLSFLSFHFLKHKQTNKYENQTRKRSASFTALGGGGTVKFFHSYHYAILRGFAVARTRCVARTHDHTTFNMTIQRSKSFASFVWKGTRKKQMKCGGGVMWFLGSTTIQRSTPLQIPNNPSTCARTVTHRFWCVFVQWLPSFFVFVLTSIYMLCSVNSSWISPLELEPHRRSGNNGEPIDIQLLQNNFYMEAIEV